MPGRAGTSRRGMPSSRARAAACSGPAPPKAKRVKSRGSAPSDSETMRMAPAMRVSAMRSTAAAAASGLEAERARRGSRRRCGGRVATPVKRRGSRRPSRRLASEMVGSRAAAAVGDRAGLGAGALGADLEQAGGVDAGDRAAAGADGAHVDHRHVDRHGVFELDLVGDLRRAAADQRHVGRGAAHVVGDEVGDAGAAGGVDGGHDAGGGAGHHGLRRLAGDLRGRDHAAVAGHHQDLAAVAAAPSSACRRAT